MGIKNIFATPAALQEFGLLARGIYPIMIDKKSTTVEERRIVLNELVNKLSEKTFKNNMIAEQIIKIINMEKEECEKFSITDTQVNSILTWLPRMALHRDKLANKVEQARKNFGLNLEEEILEYK
jgi:hypothetical protein